METHGVSAALYYGVPVMLLGKNIPILQHLMTHGTIFVLKKPVCGIGGVWKYNRVPQSSMGVMVWLCLTWWF